MNATSGTNTTGSSSITTTDPSALATTTTASSSSAVSNSSATNSAALGATNSTSATTASATAATGAGGSTSSGTTTDATLATTSAGTTGISPTGPQYWIAPDGSDSASGSEDQPWATLAPAAERAEPGLTIWVKPGTYEWADTQSITELQSGSEASPIVVQPTSGRPVFDFSEQPSGVSSLRGINLAGSYWHIKGLEIVGASDNCIAISGSYNTIEDVIVHECGDTGIQITAPSTMATDNSRAAYNTILNCDAWGNIDVATGGENADGFAAKLRIGPGNVFRGCRAWNNADDGWDLFAADDVVTIDNCWAFSNGIALGGANPAGDGNGFKLGGAPNGPGQGGAVHIVTNSFGFENKTCGFTRNNNPDMPSISDCGAKDNQNDFCLLDHSNDVSMSMSASSARTVERTANGDLPPMQ